jgi:hypothetical protein
MGNDGRAHPAGQDQRAQRDDLRDRRPLATPLAVVPCQDDRGREAEGEEEEQDVDHPRGPAELAGEESRELQDRPAAGQVRGAPQHQLTLLQSGEEPRYGLGPLRRCSVLGLVGPPGRGGRWRRLAHGTISVNGRWGSPAKIGPGPVTNNRPVKDCWTRPRPAFYRPQWTAKDGHMGRRRRLASTSVLTFMKTAGPFHRRHLPRFCLGAALVPHSMTQNSGVWCHNAKRPKGKSLGALAYPAVRSSSRGGTRTPNARIMIPP